MKLQIVQEFECGETTCAVEPGKFCRFVRSMNFGQNFGCALFRVDDTDRLTPLSEKDGWLRRLPQCLALNNERNRTKGRKK